MSNRRDGILREMGLAPLWRLRSRQAAVRAPFNAPDAAAEAVAEDAASIQKAAVRRAASAPAVPPDRHEAAPVRPGRAREPVAPPADRGPAVHAHGAAPSADAVPHPLDPQRRARIASLEWDALEADIRACTACRLCERRTQAVPGVGDRRADWMLVGEGPGAEEDQRGEPFVGAAGKLLDAMLGAIGLKRGEGVYIANAVKCRPPHNRTPQADEIATCFPYLERQIELVRPRILIALGRPAAQALLAREVSIGGSRGQAFRYRATPLVVTYHPAYLLRNQADKAKAWEDLCFARRLLA